MEADDFLAHYGVKGMRWGHRKAESSEPSARQVKREQYKKDLKSGREKTKAGREDLTPAETRAMNVNATKKIAVIMGTYGGLLVASHFAQKGIENKMAQRMSEAATRGAQFNNRNLKQVGDLSTFVLRKGANGSWG